VNDKADINLTLDNFLMNLTRKLHYQVKTKSIDGSGFCPNVSFEDNEFKENKALNDQGKVKDEGTIIVTAQLNLNMSLSLT
jgi:hypothetical protein